MRRTGAQLDAVADRGRRASAVADASWPRGRGRASRPSVGSPTDAVAARRARGRTRDPLVAARGGRATSSARRRRAAPVARLDAGRPRCPARQRRRVAAAVAPSADAHGSPVASRPWRREPASSPTGVDRSPARCGRRSTAPARNVSRQRHSSARARAPTGLDGGREPAVHPWRPRDSAARAAASPTSGLRRPDRQLDASGGRSAATPPARSRRQAAARARASRVTSRRSADIDDPPARRLTGSPVRRRLRATVARCRDGRGYARRPTEPPARLVPAARRRRARATRPPTADQRRPRPTRSGRCRPRRRSRARWRRARPVTSAIADRAAAVSRCSSAGDAAARRVSRRRAGADGIRVRHRVGCRSTATTAGASADAASRSAVEALVDGRRRPMAAVRRRAAERARQASGAVLRRGVALSDRGHARACRARARRRR